MLSNVAEIIKTQEVVKKPKITSLLHVLDKVDEKRSQELIRFRTCCADPRASK